MCIYVCVYVCMYICMYVRIYVRCKYVYMHIVCLLACCLATKTLNMKYQNQAYHCTQVLLLWREKGGKKKESRSLLIRLTSSCLPGFQ